MKKLEKIKLLTIHFYKNFMRSRTGKSIFYSLIFFIILILSIMSPSMSSKSAERIFLNFCSSIVYIIIFFLSVFGSCEFILSEIRENTIQFLFTKPLKPWEIIISKWISLNLIIITTLIVYLTISHISGFVLFKKYFFSLDVSCGTIFLSSLLLSSFAFFLASIYPSFATGVLIVIFGTGLLEFVLKSIIHSKTYNIYGFIAKKIGTYILYLLFYVFPSHQQIALKPEEILWNKTYWYLYSKYIFYVIFGSTLYLFLSIYIFGLKRKSYFKSI